MRSLYGIFRASFLELRRDRIFWPCILATVFLLFLSPMIGEWAIEEYDKILFDCMGLALELCGGLTAVIWGAQLLGLDQKDGNWELALSAPISRSQWVLGRYLGLALCLSWIAFGLALLGQGLWLVFSSGPYTGASLWLFVASWLGWLVLAAYASLLASFVNRATALFVGLGGWLIGLISRPAAESLNESMPYVQRFFLAGFAKVWDLQYFYVDPLRQGYAGTAEAMAIGAYAFGLISVFLALACLIFGRRDLHA